MTTYTYRADVGLRMEVTSSEPLTKAEIGRALGRPFAVGAGAPVLSIRFPDTPNLEIDTPLCTALNRRNSIDGRLYQCSQTAAAPIHGPVEACEHPGGCEKPEEHHEYASPGWDEPVA